MVVTTNLLDFLELSLEKVDINQLISRATKTSSSETDQPQTPTDNLEASSMSVIARDNQMSNFPVDIVVYCSVLPSTIRFRFVVCFRNCYHCVDCILRTFVAG